MSDSTQVAAGNQQRHDSSVQSNRLHPHCRHRRIKSRRRRRLVTTRRTPGGNLAQILAQISSPTRLRRRHQRVGTADCRNARRQRCKQLWNWRRNDVVEFRSVDWRVPRVDEFLWSNARSWWRHTVTSHAPVSQTLDRDDVVVSTVSHSDAISTSVAAATVDTGGEAPPFDNGVNDVPVATPPSGREDNDEFRVRFRFDSVSCDQVNTASTSLPKEPHPVRDQTVNRRSSPRNNCLSVTPSCESSTNNILLCPPPSPQPPRQSCRSASELAKSAPRDDVPRLARWLRRRRADASGSRRRGKPSSALKKEIKAARQLGVIMGAFTVCFLPYFVCFTVVALCPDCVDTLLMTTVTWIGYLNSTLNPFLYPLCNAAFRRKFRRMLGCMWAPLRARNTADFMAPSGNSLSRVHSQRQSTRRSPTHH